LAVLGVNTKPIEFNPIAVYKSFLLKCKKILSKRMASFAEIIPPSRYRLIKPFKKSFSI
jgi:hypothetical protein